jgi:hypothetical protein
MGCWYILTKQEFNPTMNDKYYLEISKQSLDVLMVALDNITVKGIDNAKAVIKATEEIKQATPVGAPQVAKSK